MTGDGNLWQRVNNERRQFFSFHFGMLPRDILKITHLTGVWPGGGLYQIDNDATHKNMSIYTSFGLTNPDLPTTVTLSESIDETFHDRSKKRSAVLTPKKQIPSYPFRAGYGYEIAIIADRTKEWPLWFLQWIVEAEILNDADFSGRVEKYQGVTIQAIPVGEEGEINVLIQKALSPFPSHIPLSNGNAELLIATTITDDEMRWSKIFGRRELSDLLFENKVGQKSDLHRPSICRLAPLPGKKTDGSKRREILKGFFRFVPPLIDTIIETRKTNSTDEGEVHLLQKTVAYGTEMLSYPLGLSEKNKVLIVLIKTHLFFKEDERVHTYCLELLNEGAVSELNQMFHQFKIARDKVPDLMIRVHHCIHSSGGTPSLWRALNILYKMNYRAVPIDQLEMAFSSAIRCNMGECLTWNSMGIAYFYKNEFGKAIICYQRAAERSKAFDKRFDVNQEMFHGNIAEAFIELGRYKEALRAAEKALNFIPDSKTSIGFKIEALLKMGEVEAATEFVYEMVTLYPGLQGIEQMLP